LAALRIRREWNKLKAQGSEDGRVMGLRESIEHLEENRQADRLRAGEGRQDRANRHCDQQRRRMKREGGATERQTAHLVIRRPKHKRFNALLTGVVDFPPRGGHPDKPVG
jgi:hypothetical protein